MKSPKRAFVPAERARERKTERERGGKREAARKWGLVCSRRVKKIREKGIERERERQRESGGLFVLSEWRKEERK
jgi:hypothetical protein